MIRTKFNENQLPFLMCSVLIDLKSRRLSRICKNYCKGIKTMELDYKPGLFMNAVLEGDYSIAMARATWEQFKLLETLPHYSKRWAWGIQICFGYEKH